MIPATEALALLEAGNLRFVRGRPRSVYALDSGRRAELAAGQSPFAAVLGCSDSRVPPEVVFDQPLGELFVVRVAGNVAGPHQVGSVEFAATELGVRLVVVMGHAGCGAIAAALDSVRNPGPPVAGDLSTVVDRIVPAVESALDGDGPRDECALARRATRANIRAAVDNLRYGSRTLAALAESDGLLVVGAEHDIAGGGVEFFHD